MRAGASRKEQPFAGMVLGLLTLALLLVAALAPATGAIPADTACPYGNCPQSPTTSFFQTIAGLATILVIAVVVVAVVVALLVRWSRGRQPHSGGESSEGPSDYSPTEEPPTDYSNEGAEP